MNEKKIKSLFDSFKKLNILIIGDVMVDAYVWGTVNRISPEAPVPIVAVSKTENRLGGAANVALNIKAMGATPILCAVIGEDSNGKLVNSLLKKEKMSTEGILAFANRTTTAKTRIIGNNHQMLRIDDEKIDSITAQQTQIFLKSVAKLFAAKKIDAIIFEDYDKGVITPDLIYGVVELAKKYNVPVTVDPKRNNFLAYKNVTLFKPNLRELNEGLNLGFELNEKNDFRKAVAALNKKINSKITLITLSEKGVYVAEGKNDFLRAAHVRNISDVSGAGDTVIAVATLCLASKTSIDFMAELANLAGGLVCEKVGVVPVQKNQLLEEAILLLAAE